MDPKPNNEDIRKFLDYYRSKNNKDKIISKEAMKKMDDELANPLGKDKKTKRGK